MKYEAFWLKIKFKVEELDKLDIYGDIIHGARSETFGGHNYKILPTLSEKEIAQIESEKSIQLPDELKFYLLTFGSGGAGPDYGVIDFKEAFSNVNFDKPFIYKENYAEDGIEDVSGLLYLGTAGCDTNYYIELKGENIGTVWCDWSSGGSNKEGNLCDFYQSWLDDAYTALTRHQHQLIQSNPAVKQRIYYTQEQYDSALEEIIKKTTSKPYKCSNCQYPVEYNRITPTSTLILILSTVLSGIIGNSFWGSWWFALAGFTVAIITLVLLGEEVNSKPSSCPVCKVGLEKPLEQIS